MEIHRGCEGTDKIPFLVCRCMLGASQCTSTHLHTHTCGVPRPPAHPTWPQRAFAMELKRNKLLPVGQNTPNPNTPSPPNRIKTEKDGHWNWPRRGGKQ